MKNPKILFSFIFIAVIVEASICFAKITKGKCPEVRGNEFNCTEIALGFNRSEKSTIPLLPFAVLSSSIQIKHLNIFAFNAVFSSKVYVYLKCKLPPTMNDVINFDSYH